MKVMPARSKILIVDDTRESVQALVEALGPGYEICVAVNGDDALKAASSEPPNLVLLDTVLPDLDGYEVCTRLKAEERTCKIPIIFITTSERNEDEKRGLELGAVDYIAKPFCLPILKARIETHLELERNREILEKMAYLDGLTGVRNYRYFKKILAMEWRRMSRRAFPLSLVLVDIDFFKKFNDSYGHTIGDDCLKQVAATLSDSVRRPADFVARYGGEEFVALLPETDGKAAHLMAEVMRKRVESLDIEHVHHPSGRVTISLGVATIVPKRDMTSEVLVQTAGRMLLLAKDSGRNRIKSTELS